MATYTLDRARLKERREKLGITRMEASKRLQLSQPSYLRYENGTRHPSLQILKLMADMLNTSVDYLIGESNSPKKDVYIVELKKDPALFAVVEKCHNFDKDQLKRLKQYAAEIAKQK